MSILFFMAGLFSIVVALYFLLSIKKPGFYPPPHLLKRRAFVFTVSGLLLFLLGIIF